MNFCLLFMLPQTPLHDTLEGGSTCCQQGSPGQFVLPWPYGGAQAVQHIGWLSYQGPCCGASYPVCTAVAVCPTKVLRWDPGSALYWVCIPPRLCSRV